MSQEPNTCEETSALATAGLSIKARGYLLVLLAGIMWSTSGLFAKSPLFSEWPVATRGATLAFWRAVFACSVLILLVRRPRWNWRIVPMTLMFMLMNYTFLQAMTYTSAANTIWLQYIAPAWVFVIGVYVLKEKVQRGDWPLMVLGMTGVAFILSRDGA